MNMAGRERGTISRAMRRSSAHSPTHSQSHSSKRGLLETASSPSAVVHGPLRLLSSRKSGEKSGLWEGEDLPVSLRGHLCFPGRLAAETGAQQDVELRTEAVTNERGWITALARTSPAFSQSDRDGLGAAGCGLWASGYGLRWVQDRARRTGDEGTRLRPGYHSAVSRWHEILK